jgi:spore maturation protein SpmA
VGALGVIGILGGDAALVLDAHFDAVRKILDSDIGLLGLLSLVTGTMRSW